MCLTLHSFFMSLISISVPFTCWKRFHRGTPSIFRNNDSKTPPFCRPLQQPSQTTFPSKKPSHFTFPPWLIYSRIKKIRSHPTLFIVCIPLSFWYFKISVKFYSGNTSYVSKLLLSFLIFFFYYFTARIHIYKCKVICFFPFID